MAKRLDVDIDTVVSVYAILSDCGRNVKYLRPYLVDMVAVKYSPSSECLRILLKAADIGDEVTRA